MAKWIKTDKPHSVFSLEADRDYIIARLVNFTGSAFSPRAAYYAQQALEKYMKAFLVLQNGQYLKTHNLLELVEVCSKSDKDFSEKKFIEKIGIFNDFIEVGRYGGESSYDPHSKITKEFRTAGVMIWSDSNVEILDELVSVIRGKLDFARAGFSDSLKAVLEENRENYLVGTWNFPIKLKDILISGNKFFK